MYPKKNKNPIWNIVQGVLRVLKDIAKFKLKRS